MKTATIVMLCLFLASCATAGYAPTILEIQYEPKPLADGDRTLIAMPEGWRSVRKASFAYDGERACNIYFPAGGDPTQARPIVLVANGYAKSEELAMRSADGAFYKDLGPIASWGVALAASGLVAVTYDAFEPDLKYGEKPKAPISIGRLADFLKKNEKALGIDLGAIGVLAMGPSAKRFQATLATNSAWLAGLRRVAYNWPVVDSRLLPRRRVKTLLIRSGKMNSAILFELDDYAALLKSKGFEVEVMKNATGGYNYDSVIDNAETRASIRAILDFFKGLSG